MEDEIFFFRDTDKLPRTTKQGLWAHTGFNSFTTDEPVESLETPKRWVERLPFSYISVYNYENGFRVYVWRFDNRTGEIKSHGPLSHHQTIPATSFHPSPPKVGQGLSQTNTAELRSVQPLDMAKHLELDLETLEDPSSNGIADALKQAGLLELADNQSIQLMLGKPTKQDGKNLTTFSYWVRVAERIPLSASEQTQVKLDHLDENIAHAATNTKLVTVEKLRITETFNSYGSVKMTYSELPKGDKAFSAIQPASLLAIRAIVHLAARTKIDEQLGASSYPTTTTVLSVEPDHYTTSSTIEQPLAAAANAQAL